MHSQLMSEGPGPYLLDALKRVLDGGELRPEEPRAAIASPQALSGHEKDAWEQLVHWADEADMRARDANYATFHLDWLRDLHARLAPQTNREDNDVLDFDSRRDDVRVSDRNDDGDRVDRMARAFPQGPAMGG